MFLPTAAFSIWEYSSHIELNDKQGYYYTYSDVFSVTVEATDFVLVFKLEFFQPGN